MDGDGVCDAMDDDIDGDGVNNDDDFAQADKSKARAAAPTARPSTTTRRLRWTTPVYPRRRRGSHGNGLCWCYLDHATSYSDDMVMVTMIMDMTTRRPT